MTKQCHETETDTRPRRQRATSAAGGTWLCRCSVMRLAADVWKQQPRKSQTKHSPTPIGQHATNTLSLHVSCPKGHSLINVVHSYQEQGDVFGEVAR